MLLCENNTYYTGYTTDMARRYQEHLAGSAKCKYTRSFKPLRIAQSWQIGDKSLAMQIEKYIKNLSKPKKVALVLAPQLLTELFDCAVYAI